MDPMPAQRQKECSVLQQKLFPHTQTGYSIELDLKAVLSQKRIHSLYTLKIPAKQRTSIAIYKNIRHYFVLEQVVVQ